MTNDKGTRRTCEHGHSYYKKSDCPTCPICESKRKPKEGVLALLSAPARRALEKMKGLQRWLNFRSILRKKS